MRWTLGRQLGRLHATEARNRAGDSARHLRVLVAPLPAARSGSGNSCWTGHGRLDPSGHAPTLDRHFSRSGPLGMKLTVSYAFTARNSDYPQLSLSHTTTYLYPYHGDPEDAVSWDSRFLRSFSKLSPSSRRALAQYIVGLGNPFVWDVHSLLGPVDLLEYYGIPSPAALIEVGVRRGYPRADLLWIETPLRGESSRGSQLLGWDSGSHRWVLLAHQAVSWKGPIVED